MYLSGEELAIETAGLRKAGWREIVITNVRNTMTHVLLVRGINEMIDQHPDGGWVIGRYMLGRAGTEQTVTVFVTAEEAAVTVVMLLAAGVNPIRRTPW